MDRHKAWALPAVLLACAPIGCTGNGDDSASPTPKVAEAAAPPAALNCSNDGGDWPMYGQNVCNTRGGTSAAEPITTSTVSKLKVKWTFTAAGDISATPAVVDGQVYVPDWGGNLNRVDGATGQGVWSKNVGDLIMETSDVDAGQYQALLTSYTAPMSRITPVVYGNNVIFGMGAPGFSATIAAVDKDTAELKWKTPLDPHEASLLTSSPTLDDGVIYIGVSSGEEIATQIPGYPCCSFRGSVAALDAATGALKWQTPMIEDSVFYKADKKTLSGYAGAAVWSGTPTVDRNRHLVYVTTGNNYAIPKGAPNPLPAGDHVEAIVALDMTTGAIKWSSRMVPAGGSVWTVANNKEPDYDFGCGANLFQTTINGAVVDVVGAGQKSGVYWALNADTGSTLWSTEVGPGGHLGGIHWSTAVDSHAVYVGVNDETGTPYTMGGSGPQAGMMTPVGSWAALELAGAPGDGGTNHGKIIWQVANPAMTAPLMGGSVNGPTTVINGVVFAGSMDAKGMMYALDSATGKILWSFMSGASVYSGPAVVNGVVYWGVGYPSSRLGLGSSASNNQLYAFDLGG
ncbi:MAG TPA: PQQ-binding-like beta-propeller repeat protein [Polyangiaceae bacterium]|nr:PQQ-binding-like beta-propeller repeat protein [Polyangiaceae bacterium]